MALTTRSLLLVCLVAASFGAAVAAVVEEQPASLANLNVGPRRMLKQFSFNLSESLGGTLPPLPPLGELFKNRTAVVPNSPDCANAPPPSGPEDCVGTSVYCSRSGDGICECVASAESLLQYCPTGTSCQIAAGISPSCLPL